MAKTEFKLSENGLTWLVLGLNVVVLAGLLFWGWQALQVTPEKLTEARAEEPGATAKPAAPVLQTNTTHRRQGEIIQVNPTEIGKANPFQ